MLSAVDADVAVLQETHLRPGESTPRLAGWQEFRKDRRLQGEQGAGGVMILVRDQSFISTAGFDEPAAAASDLCMGTEWQRLRLIPVTAPGHAVEPTNMYILRIGSTTRCSNPPNGRAGHGLWCAVTSTRLLRMRA